MSSLSSPIDTSRPRRLIGVVGTHTEVGKTWVTSQLLSVLLKRGLNAAARKPIQSYSPDSGPTDADQLAAASGESRDSICLPHRCYELPMAPPMAADALGRESISLDALIAEIRWPPDSDIGFVETVGGARSPLAHDGDSVDLIKRLSVDEVLLVADAGLGTLNAVRLTLACLAPLPTTVILNRYDPADDLHRRNRDWLLAVDGIAALTDLKRLALRF
jgi:dethiobiotin synthetase